MNNNVDFMLKEKGRCDKFMLNSPITATRDQLSIGNKKP